MDGIYSRLNKWIRTMKSNGSVVIDRRELTKRLDYSEMSREELEARCKNVDVSMMLYQNGFRSVVKGKGVFVDSVEMKNPDTIAQLVRNATASTEQKKQVELALREALKNLEKSEDFGSQIAFDEDMTLFEEMSRDELIEVLRELAQ